MLGRHHQAFAECVSRSTGGPLSLAESQLPVFHSLSTQLKEVQAMIHKLELQVLDQDRILKERAELACKQEHHLEAKVRELESKQDSTQAIGEAARALESVTGKMQTRLAEVQQMRQDLAQAEDHMRQLKSENQQMKACIECMKTKMLEVEECGAKTAQGWKKECDQLKADVCSLRSAAEDLCAQLHKANQKCTKLESVHSRLRDTCIDTSSSSPSMSDNEHGNRKEETAAGAISESLAATSSRKAAQIENLVAPDVTKRINRKRKYKMDFDQLAKKLTTTNSRSTAERHHDWPFGWESEL
ncbi:unnamed protein product [Notodromas monacha]|uniref:Uncharacterized protein n=1 Tax=Notodromas monacha TaxID=399045 RepID=A0A7R9BTR4_9CRUS|nr:unnamed protein product [Notodromas monacha]CAG0920526.1 unnamed protein product [Notodromas monacha]